jgi:hypothetical protein
MENTYIVIAHSIFSETAICFSKKLNIPIIKDLETIKECDLVIVFGAHEISYALLDLQQRKQCVYIIMNSEQVNSQFLQNKYYLRLLKQNHMFDYNAISSQYLKDNHDIKTYSFFFFEFLKEQNQSEVREIDIFFCGSRNDKRAKIEQELKEAYPDKNIVFDYSWSYQAPVDMKKVLNKSKYVLNIPYYEDNALEVHRINNALSCGCKVVSSPSKDKAAIEYYKDYIHFTEDFVSWFRNEVDSKELKTYDELVADMNMKLLPHNEFMIKEIQKKINEYIYGFGEKARVNPSDEV